MPEDLPVVPSMDDLNAVLVRVALLEAQVKVMPDTVKAALKMVLDWMYTNV